MKLCKDCGREFDESELSRRGLCETCGLLRVEESIRQMTAQKGPIYEKYVAGLARIGRRLKGEKV